MTSFTDPAPDVLYCRDEYAISQLRVSIGINLNVFYIRNMPCCATHYKLDLSWANLMRSGSGLDGFDDPRDMVGKRVGGGECVFAGPGYVA
jgi:hypothetical protein